MKFNKLVVVVLATLVMGGTSFLNASTNVETSSDSELVYLSYYGQVNSNGTVRTKRVNGYYKRNGTYVNSYYRS